MKKVILSVTNDLVTDQRLEKTANFLVDEGFNVLTVGRKYRHSPTLSKKNYKTKRLSLLFKKGFCFYAEYNVRLFLFLLFQKVDILVANDLDTLLPNFLISKIRKKKIIYDSHEYFCGLPELKDRPFVRSFWQKIEKFCFPHLQHVITVSESIATLYEKLYPLRKEKIVVVRNLPSEKKCAITETRQSLQLPVDKKIIIMQGSINVDRGAEELIEAMAFIENSLLLIIGDGDMIASLKELVITSKMEGKVLFIPRLTPDKLYNYTCLADVGCSLEKDTNLNYRFCLPNKLFDYLHAGIPVVVSNMTEMSRIVLENDVGIVIQEHNPKNIAAAINKLYTDHSLYEHYKNNIAKITPNYTWEREIPILKDLYNNVKNEESIA